MSQTTRWLACFALVILGACADTPTQNSDKLDAADPEERIFPDAFESVWRAVQLAMADYPIRVNSQDAGIIETDFIRSGQAWKNPARSKDAPGGLRYKINVQVLLLKNKNETTNRVIVLKNAELQEDFFSEFKKYPSDGLEEAAIIYRVERELKIERALKALNNSGALEP